MTRRSRRSPRPPARVPAASPPVAGRPVPDTAGDRPGGPPHLCSSSPTALPQVDRDRRRLWPTLIERLARRHRAVRDRRRARLGIPLLASRLPRSSCVARRRHRAHRPDPVRRRPERRVRAARARRSATPSGSSTPPAKTWPASPSSACARRCCSTPSSPAGCSTTRGSGSRSWSRSCSASGCARSTRRSTGRGARFPSRGSSTPPSTSSCWSSCATSSPRSSTTAGKREWAEQEFAAWARLEPADAAPRALAPDVGDPSRPRPPRARTTCARCGSCATTSPGAATSRPTGSSPIARSSRRPRQRPRRATRSGGSRASRRAAGSATCASSRPDRRGSRAPGDGAASACRRQPTARPRRACGPTRTRPRPHGWADAARPCRHWPPKSDLPQENLVSPDAVRRLAWEPPAEVTAESVASALTGSGARAWQVDLVAEALADAVSDPESA